MSSYIGYGLAKGAAQIGPEIERREQAKLEREKAELQLQEYKNQAPLRQSQQEQEITRLKAETYQLNASMLRDKSYNAFDRYVGSLDISHLNDFLASVKQNPTASMYHRIARFDPLQDTEETRKMLMQAGYKDPGEVFQTEAAKGYTLATMADGTQTLFDMNKMYALTGYARYSKNRDIERQIKEQQLLRAGMSSRNISQLESIAAKIKEENPGMTNTEAYTKAQEILKQGAGSGEERIISQIAEEQNISLLEATEQYYSLRNQGKGNTDQERFIQDYLQNNPGATRQEASTAYANRAQTSTQKEQSTVTEAKDALDKMDFFNMDMSKMDAKQRADVHRYVAEIEDMRGIKLATEDKRLLRDLRNLTMLGGKAGSELTDAETGLVDRMFNSVKSYMSENVGGKEATAAYESFRNIFRNALYGASLTATEVEAFNKAVGTLGQQTGPILAQLKVQMESIVSQLESIRDTNDPYIAQYYFGRSIDDVDEVIRSIEERINYFSSTQPGKPKSRVIAAPKPKQSLEELQRRIRQQGAN